MTRTNFYREFRQTLAGVLAALAGWLFIAPFGLLIPRRRDWLAVIGRDEGKFVDNAKYFYLQANTMLRNRERCAFITERQDVATMLAARGHDALIYPSWQAVWYLLRAGNLVVDSTEWHLRMRRFLSIGCKRVQLWHGVGFKRIELDKWQNEAIGRGWVSWPILRSIRSAKRHFMGRIVRYDLVNTTSVFYLENVFRAAFLSRHYTAFGYPRNAFSASMKNNQAAAWWNVDEDIARHADSWVKDGRRIVLVTPTFRDTRATPMGLSEDIVSALDAWCEQHRVELVFKFHPFERRASEIRGKHLHLCSPHSDLYPIMPLASAMVTDYSSIYMDYLLLSRPIIFLVPDLQEYIRTDRQLQFDFRAMTPGPKVATWREVTQQLESQWLEDTFVDSRAALAGIAFDDISQDQAVPNLLSFMRAQGWLSPDERAVSVASSEQSGR